MEYSGSLQHLLEDPTEDAGTLDWMKLTAPPDQVAEVEGGPDNLPIDSNLDASQYSRLEQRLGIVTEVLLGVKDGVRECDRMLRELLGRNNKDFGQHDTIYMVPNPIAPRLGANNPPEEQPANNIAGNSDGASVGQGNSVTNRMNATSKGNAILIDGDSSRADFDVIVPNSPVEGEDEHFVPETLGTAVTPHNMIHNHGSHLWAIGIAKSNGESSSSKRREDCEASEDKRRRIEAPLPETGSPNGSTNYVPTLQRVQITALEVNAPLNLSRLNDGGNNDPSR
ncbi:hypothetical protein PIB30_035303 [Stylosanthes scabra]|uniref:Uncharacterized protein n=1 Tax=Stylosanthes scabra TaxID=79078 RepID=A0ABU6QCI8_9FABA|nr:hypothetical protein [Stylosanthes scabra]